MKIKKTILILTSEHKKNKGIDDLKEYLNKYFDDFDVFIIDENQTGGKGAAKRRSDINRFFIQNYGGELSPRAFIEEKIRSFRAEAGIKHSAKSQERVKNAMLRFNPESVLATTPEMLYYAVEAKKREDLSCKVIGLVNSFTFDKRYFPEQGLSLKADYALYTDNFVTYDGGAPFSAVSLDLQTVVPITRRVKLLPSIYGRVLIGNTIPYPYLNYMGGTLEGRYIDHCVQ